MTEVSFCRFVNHKCGVSSGMSHGLQLFPCCFEFGLSFESQTELWLANDCAGKKKKKNSTSSKVNAIWMFLVCIYKYMFLRDTLSLVVGKVRGGGGGGWGCLVFFFFGGWRLCVVFVSEVLVKVYKVVYIVLKIQPQIGQKKFLWILQFPT